MARTSPAHPFDLSRESFLKNLFHPLPNLILQIIAIILVSGIFGALFHKIRQPTVIGEIVAGESATP